MTVLAKKQGVFVKNFWQALNLDNLVKSHPLRLRRTARPFPQTIGRKRYDCSQRANPNNPPSIKSDLPSPWYPTGADCQVFRRMPAAPVRRFVWTQKPFTRPGPSHQKAGQPVGARTGGEQGTDVANV